jgi:dTDP-4-dehydrorhamnose 3,5-epimerase
VKVSETELPGVLLVEPQVFGDARGFFTELYREERYRSAGIADVFVQDNLSRSARGVLRGLHFQHPRDQAKLVYVVSGEVLDVAVDVRAGSPTFGRWVSARLSGTNHCQLYLPVGFAHGFCVLSDEATFGYKCSAAYAPECERCVRWDDPEIGIAWPLEGPPSLSGRDAAAPLLRALPREHLPPYAPAGR